MKILINILLIFIIVKGNAQCPIANFSLLKDTVCIGEVITLTPTNNIKNNNYNWDVCSGSLLLSGSGSKLIENASTPWGIDGVYDGVNTYLFFINTIARNVIRVKLENNFKTIIDSDTVAVIDFLGYPSGLKIVQEDSLWYGFIIDSDGGELVKLEFGSSLENQPDVFDLGNVSSISPNPNPINLDVLIYGDTTVLCITNFSDKSITFVEFDSLFQNYSPKVYNFSIDGLVNGPTSLTIAKDCNYFYVFVGSYYSQNIVRLKFNSLSNPPTDTLDMGNLNGNITGGVRMIEMINYMGYWRMFVLQTDLGNNAGNMLRVDFTDSLNNSTPDVFNLGDFGVIAAGVVSFTLEYNNSDWHIFFGGGHLQPKNIFQVSFNALCDSLTNQSYDSDSFYVAYQQTGTYKISLNIIDSSGNESSFLDSLEIIGPIARFRIDSSFCFGNSITFSDSSIDITGNIIQRTFKFGDGDSSTLKTPTHIYKTTSQYTVNLTVLSDNGCKNSVTQNIKVINKPNIIYSLDNGCVIDSFFFKNNTAFDTLIDIWYWQFGDGDTSKIQNPSHLYSDTGKFQITFVTGVEGCTDTIIDTITFYPKPVANFNSTDICIGDSTNFNDSSSVYLSSLTPINKWSWNLGDTNTSSNQFPKHLYADSGKYSVSLIVTTTINCSDTITKSIDIQKPLAKFLIKEKICDNFPIPFIDTSTVNADSIVSWKWAFVSGDSSASQYPTYSFPDSGIFNIYLKVKSSQNCTHDTVIPIYVNLGPTVSFAFDTVCAETPTSFFDNSTIVLSDTIITWAWDFGDSSASDNSQNAQHIYSEGAQYSITLNVTTQKGCKGIKINNIIAKPLPAVNFGYSTVCVNNNVNFFDYSSVNNVINDSIISWKWFFDDGNSSTSQNPANLYTSSTTKNVLLIAFTNNNCFDSLIKPVIINPLPVIDYTYSEVCEPETTSFSSSSSLYNLFWTFDDPTSGNNNKSTAFNPIHLYKNAGSYFVNLIAVSSDNCTTKVNKTVSVSFIPTANFITDSICEIYPANFFDSSYVTQASIAKWKWDFDDGTQIDTSQNPIHSFTDTGKYTVNLFVFSEKGCSSETSKNIQVFQLPDANFDFTPQFGIPPLNVSFKNKTNNVISYKWNFGDGDTSLDANPSHTYADTGEYVIKFYAINEYACMDTLRDLIRVKAPVLDLIVNELLLKLNSNYYESTVNFTNIGNRDIEIINFELEFVNGSTVLEQWSGTLLPSDDDTYIFSSKTKNESISQSDVVCVSAILINDEQDDNPEDNKQCVTLNKEIDLLSPIYDYENKTITIQIISNKEQDILINFYDQLGKVLHKGTVICYEGYNTVEINVARQQAGLYIYTINNDNELIAGKATILN